MTGVRSLALNQINEVESGQVIVASRSVGKDRWSRMTFPGQPGRWEHFDASQFKGEAAEDPTQADILNLIAVVGAATTVQGDTHALSGSIDFTKMAGERP